MGWRVNQHYEDARKEDDRAWARSLSFWAGVGTLKNWVQKVNDNALSFCPVKPPMGPASG